MAGSVSVDALMEIERYSHVMHISSTVTGKLLPELGVWDVLRAALPAGTVSGAPKVRLYGRMSSSLALLKPERPEGAPQGPSRANTWPAWESEPRPRPPRDPNV